MSQKQLVPVNLYTAASDPTVPTITAGDMYFNTSTGVRVYDGTAWVAVGSGATANAFSWIKTASGGETSLSGNDNNGVALNYTVGQELLYINGVLQVRGQDYIGNTGNSITGLSPALTVNDQVFIWAPNTFSVANTYTIAETNALFQDSNILNIMKAL